MDGDSSSSFRYNASGRGHVGQLLGQFMSSTPHEPSSREQRVDETIATYLQAVHRGECPDLARLLADDADIAAELNSFFANQSLFRRADGDAAPGSNSQSKKPVSPNGKLASDTDEPTLTFQERGVSSPQDITRYFGDYELLLEIARGGMGVVFKARQVSLNRIVAVKMILAGSFAGPEGVQRFRTEAEAAAQLDHPGIVPIYEVGQHEGQHYFSMGFVDGQSLSKRVAESPLPAREAAEIVRAVANAVQYAHDKGVIHRDLKPGNILMDKAGKPRVTDFGLAKLTESSSDLTGTGQVLGTPSYMPPEQAAGQVSAVGRLADVYSLGAILYCLLTGRPPFQAATPLETILQVKTQEPVSPRQLNAGIPLDLNTIALKCLEKDPARRYESARNVADELERFLNGEPIVARPISTVERGWRWCKRKPLIPSVVAAVLAISTVAGLAFRHFSAIERGKILQREEKSLQREVVTAVDAVQNSRGPVVPFTIRDLKKLPSKMPLLELKSRYAAAESDRKLPLAYALSEYGEVDAEFLCSQIKQSAPEDVANFVTAFEHDRDASLAAIQSSAAQGYSAQDWRLKARLATVALHLDNETIAADVCQIDDRPDPVQRTIFIDELPIWHGNLEKLVSHCKELSDPALRSALCMGVGSIPVDRLTSAETAAWKPVLSEWYQTAPDNVTHSAAGWALREWKADLPVVSTSSQPDENHERFVNSLGMTMLKIRPGRFVRSAFFRAQVDQTMKKTPQTVTLTRAFYLSDREVTISQFRQFVNDPQCPNEEKPENWQQANGAVNTVRDEYPKDSVNWYDCVLFCNWLSRKESLAPGYERTGKKLKLRNFQNEEREVDEWRLAANGGYRLPTEAEWEYACRAGTTTDYASGSDLTLLRKYAVYQTGDSIQAAACASKLPNGWGLFDMHGNVWEWCYDWYAEWYAEYPAGDLSDPIGLQVPLDRVIRGGGCGNAASYCQSADRGRNSPVTRHVDSGFRLARSSVR
jgi:serine/threonine protein kinase/formylglycine-generating enzyme required for sulfatase activity